MENVEIEYKVMINKNNFYKLLNILGSNFKYYDQTNYYYDDNNLVHKAGLSLRIRHIINENKYITTLKENLKIGKLEHEYEIKDNDINYLHSDIIKILDDYHINYKNLKLIGFLNTKRYEYKIDDSLLCLDFNTYCNIQDYEIECESGSLKKAKKIIDKLLKENDIDYEISTKSKQKRAREAFKQ